MREYHVSWLTTEPDCSAGEFTPKQGHWLHVMAGSREEAVTITEDMLKLSGVTTARNGAGSDRPYAEAGLRNCKHGEALPYRTGA
jgi:hypothetical protein